MEKIKVRMNKTDLFRLFMVCAFPIHLWYLVLVLRDLNWISIRTDMWDAIGVGSYAMLYAFIESVVFFLLVTGLYSLVPARWPNDKALVLSGFSALQIALWAGTYQVYRYLDFSSPGFLVDAFLTSGHPLRYFVLGVAALVVIVIGTIALPAYLIIFKQGVIEKFIQIFERISLLSGLYLFVDLIGLVIVIFRNVS